MPRPVALANGVYHLNVRIPKDLVARVKGTVVNLPLEGEIKGVRASDKVILSLRTKDPALAKVRFRDAEAALFRHFDAVRAGPKPLSHKQQLALAGEFYRKWVAEFEEDPDAVADDPGAEAEFERAVAEWRAKPEVAAAEDPESEARWQVELRQPNGPQALALRHKMDIDEHGFSVTYAEALEGIYGPEVDEALARHHLVVDAPTRLKLLGHFHDAVSKVQDTVLRLYEGDYSPDAAAVSFPAFDAPAPAPKPQQKVPARAVETVSGLFERWQAHHVDKKAPSTIRRYAPSLTSLDAFAKGRDWRSLTEQDIFDWATRRHEVEGVAPATVNRNDLVAVASVLAWPTTLSGKKMSTVNPAAGVKVDLPRKAELREKTFRAAEVSAILRLARSVVPNLRHPRASASRRWSPWICAYTGARIQEVQWLQKSDVWNEAGVDVMRFPQTKTGRSRVVPLHQRLIDEGFLDFVAAAPDGFLFVGDREQRPGSTRSMPEKRATEIAAWIQKNISLDEGIGPNHAWRHTWATQAEAAGIPKRFSNQMTGHGKKDASDGYVDATVAMLAAEMTKFPAYPLEKAGSASPQVNGKPPTFKPQTAEPVTVQTDS